MSETGKSFPATATTLDKILAVFASFGLASVVLLLLLLVTLLGTLEQLDHGLLTTQVKYFESFLITEIDMTCCLRAIRWPFHFPDGWRMPVLLPGGYFLMLLLSLNILFGGILRLKKEAVWLVHLPKRLVTGRFKELTPVPRRVGVLIAHLSIVFMLVAGVVSFYWKIDGATSVREGRTVDEFQSFHESVIEIERVQPPPADGKRSAMVIPGWQFTDLTEGKARTFTSAKLPFDLVVKNYIDHCAPRRENTAGPMVVNGYRLQEVARRDPETGKVLEHEKLINGAYVQAIDKKTHETQSGILWRLEDGPFTCNFGDEVYAISISRRSNPLPFEVTLEKFIRELHPGTAQARKFSSQVIVKRGGEGGKGENKLITMNQPLRHKGYAFFQSSFDTEAAERGGTQTSVFQVVKNPSDNWPLYSLIAAGTGILIHFVWSLVRFIRRDSHGRPQPS